MTEDDTYLLPKAATPPQLRPVPAWAQHSAPQTPARTSYKTRKFAAPSNPHQHARIIAEKVTDAWCQNFGGSNLDIPLGTIAALSLLRRPDPSQRHLDNWVLGLQSHELPLLFREIYLGAWLNRPDLLTVALRLHDWTWNKDPDTQELQAVHAVTHRAINAGLLDLTGHHDPTCRSETDVLSPLLTELRHNADRKWRGEYHTPPDVADLMARMVMDSGTINPDAAIREPAIGSGGLFRSMAQHLRELGQTPANFTWYGNDADSLAAACAAINAILWDLGPNCLIGCTNSLTTPDGGQAQALATAREAIQQRDDALAAAHTVAAFRQAFQWLDNLTEVPA